MTRALKKIRQHDLGPDLLEWLEDCARLDNHDPQWLVFVRSLIYYAMDTGNIADPEHLVAESHRLPHPAGDTLMNMAKYLEEKGKTEGEARAKRATAINLLKEGADPEFVAKVTDLTLEEVKGLRGSSAD